MPQPIVASTPIPRRFLQHHSLMSVRHQIPWPPMKITDHRSLPALTDPPYPCLPHPAPMRTIHLDLLKFIIFRIAQTLLFQPIFAPNSTETSTIGSFFSPHRLWTSP